MPILMTLFLIPFCAALIILMMRLNKKNTRRLALGLSLFPLIFLALEKHLLINDSLAYPWFPALGINFLMEVDAVSFLFLALVALVIPFSLYAVPREASQPHLFFGLIFMLQGLLFGFFMAKDLVLFTLFWEAMLLPVYLIISGWGGPDRQYTSLKFLIYTLAGSSLMVAAVLGLYFSTEQGSFNLNTLAATAASSPYSQAIFVIFLLAFAVKTPLFPFHTWLPDTYVQAPVAGTILLSALLSKAGIYGIYRIGFKLFPALLQEWSPLLLGLAIAGVLYGGLCAWGQQDYKRLLAYSSFSHVNFILAGLFVWNETAHTGAFFQALSHGITITGLFLSAGWLEERLESTSLENQKGVAKYYPTLCWMTLFFVLASIALPGTNNFVGEFLILFGVFETIQWWVVILSLSIVLSAVYMLRWMQKTYFETPTIIKPLKMDLSYKEIAVTLPLMFLILWMGMQPTPFLNLISLQSSQPIALVKESS